MLDVDDDVGGDESEVLMAPEDTYADDDFDAAPATAEADDEPAQAESSYAEDDEYKDDPEPEPEAETETEPEPTKKSQPVLDDEQSYQDDFEQGPGASKMDDEAGDTVSAAVDDDYGDDSRPAASGNSLSKASTAAAGAAAGAALTKSYSKGSAAGFRAGSNTAAAAPKPAATAAKPLSPVTALKSSSPGVAPRPAALAPKAAGPVPAAKPAPKPAAAAPKPAVAAPKPAPGAVKTAVPKSVVPVVNPKPGVPTRPIPPPAAAAQTAVGSGGQKVKLTFTGPPNVSRAAAVVKPDYSHSAYEVKKIGSDNVKLCNRLVEISRAPPNPAYANPLSVGTAAVSGKLAPANVAASAVNRQRKGDRIAQENLALYKRLQTVKPSKDVNREVLNKDFAKAQAYGENARKVRSPPPVPTPTASASVPKLAASGVLRQPVAGSAEAVYMRPSGSGSGSSAQVPVAAAMEMSTVPEGPEGEVSSSSAWGASAAGGAADPEYSMDPDFEKSGIVA